MRRALLLLALCACGPKHGGGGNDDMPWDKAGVDWSKPPAPGPEPTFTVPEPVEFEVKRGVKVVLVENHRLPLISIRVVVPWAGGRDDREQVGLASLTADLLDEGAGDLDALGLAQAVERLGASLDAAVSEDATVIWLDTLASTLDDSLALLADVLRRPRFTDDDVARVRADVIEELKLRPQDPRRVANLVFDQRIYGDHPYGRPVSGHVATVEKLTADDVRTFWETHYNPSEITIVVAGDVTRDRLEDLIERHFGDWTGKIAPHVKLGTPKTREHAVSVVDRPGAPQTVVMIGTRGPDADDPDYFAREVVNTAFGGSFASRLNNRLREQLGYTYGVYSGFWRGDWLGSWSVSSSLETDVTVDGVREILAILDTARRDELPAAELEKTQQLMTRSLPQDYETDGQIAGEFAGLLVVRRPLDFYRSWVAGVRAVTAAQARAAAAASWKDLDIVVVGDWKKIGKGLSALGLEVVHYDADGRQVE